MGQRSMREILKFAWRLHSETSVSCTRNTHFQKTALSNERLVCARRTFSKSSVVSSTRDATFFEKIASRVRETTTLGGNTEPRQPKPSLARPTRARTKSCLVYAKRMFTQNSNKKNASRLRETHASKRKCRLVYARRYFF